MLGFTQRLHRSSFLGLPFRILNRNHKKELLRSLWVVWLVEESDNVAYFLSKLEELDYAFATKLLDSSNYGLPQRRLRSFQILLNRRVFEPAEALEIWV